MTKADVIKMVAERSGLHIQKAEQLVNLVFDQMSQKLKQNERIEIRGFGSFVNREYGEYKGRNPKTGDTVIVEPKRIPFFKVGKDLKVQIDESNAEPEVSALGTDEDE